MAKNKHIPDPEIPDPDNIPETEPDADVYDWSAADDPWLEDEDGEVI